MKKKYIIILVVAIAIIYGLFTGDDQQPPPQQAKLSPGSQQSVSIQQPSPKVKKGSLRTIGSWPLSGGGNQEEITVLDSDLNRKNYVLIFDGSGSMGEKKCSGNRSKVDVAKDAVSEWAVSVPEDANLGLIVFDQNGLSVRQPLGLRNRDQFRQKIKAVIPNYKTPLTASLEQAYKMLSVQGRKQLGYGEYSIVVVTDGFADDPSGLGRGVAKVLSYSPVMINTIGFCIVSNHSLNQPGRTIYKAANDPGALKQGLKEILAESETFDISAFQ